jgi:hypothetical protein
MPSFLLHFYDQQRNWQAQQQQYAGDWMIRFLEFASWSVEGGKGLVGALARERQAGQAMPIVT